MEPQVIDRITEHRTCTECGAEFDRTIDSALLKFFKADSYVVAGTGLCAECDLKRIEAQQEKERQRQRAQRFAEFRRRCPTRFLDSDIDRMRQEAGPAADRVLRWQYGPNGLLMAGPTGKCKSRLSWKLLECLWVSEGRTFEIVHFHELTTAVMDAGTFAAWRSKMVRADIVLIDDLGKARFSDRLESELFSLVDERCGWCRPLLITTNDDPGSLKARLSPDRGEPLLRRLGEFCEVISFA